MTVVIGTGTATAPGVSGSNSGSFAGVRGTNTGTGNGVSGFAESGSGVRGESDTGPGVDGLGKGNFAGVRGTNTGSGNGVSGFAESGSGVRGESDTGPGVDGLGKGNFAGVRGTNTGSGNGVAGFAESGSGVRGESDTGPGVDGLGKGNFAGVRGTNTGSGNGVSGFAEAGIGVSGNSDNGDGVRGESAGGGAGVRGISTNRDRVGVVGENTAGGFAGLFTGNVDVRGSIFCDGDIVLRNADCAEHFDIAHATEIEPGTVMVINNDGALEQSTQGYDKRVAGVVSGAGDYRPALILDKQDTSDQRMPIALIGKTFCKVDAGEGPIAVGDLLTTSSIPGHAMKAADPGKAFGAVIGKALRPHSSGRGLIPILIALQ
jgi:hypothetical protein